MSEITTVARPYARAAFEIAQSKGKLDQWSSQLAFLAAAIRDPSLRALIDSPRYTKQQRADLILKVAEGQLDEQGANFVRLLAENGKLVALPEIAGLYEFHRAEAEGSVEAEVTSAYAMSEAEISALAAGLKKRLGRDVRIKNKVDESLLGGALIQVGDMVIDGSIRGRLERMSTALSR